MSCANWIELCSPIVSTHAFDSVSISKIDSLDDVIEAAESIVDDFQAGRISATLLRRRLGHLSTMVHLTVSTSPEDREAVRKFRVVRLSVLRKLGAKP